MEIEGFLEKEALLEIARDTLADRFKYYAGTEPRYGRKAYWSATLFEEETVETICRVGMLNASVEINGYKYGGTSDGIDNNYYADTYWNRFISELHILLCTNNKKYAALRRRIVSAGSRSQVAITSAISAGLAQYVGIAAGFIVPVCALCLVSLLTLGREAFCQESSLKVKAKDLYIPVHLDRPAVIIVPEKMPPRGDKPRKGRRRKS